MNELKMSEQGYPFQFFTEEAFHAGQVINYVVNAYCDTLQYSNEFVVSPDFISINSSHLYTLGLTGRIVKLGEDHIDLFHTQEDNARIRALAKAYDGDLEKVTDTYLYEHLKIGPSDEARDVFKADIQTVLNLTHMFYINASSSFPTLNMMMHKNGPDLVSDKNIDSLFKNIPIGRVW